MPEKRDEVFSEALMRKAEKITLLLGIGSYRIHIKEQYANENSPHYEMKVGEENCNCSSQITIQYNATADGKEFSGQVLVSFAANNLNWKVTQVLVSGLFFDYVDAISVYYPEWTTIYDLSTLNISHHYN
jgi:hypothetical protein